MGQVSMRALNQDTATVMARVEAGEIVEVTRRGKVIGRIMPPMSGELDDWVTDGRVVPAAVSGPIPMPRHKAKDGEDAGELLRRMRDDERW